MVNLVPNLSVMKNGLWKKLGCNPKNFEVTQQFFRVQSIWCYYKIAEELMMVE